MGTSRSKGKAVHALTPRHEDVLGTGRITLRMFISALDGGSGQLHAPAALSPVPTGYEVEWAPLPASTL
jgi:hypothetical protein